MLITRIAFELPIVYNIFYIRIYLRFSLIPSMILQFSSLTHSALDELAFIQCGTIDMAMRVREMQEDRDLLRIATAKTFGTIGKKDSVPFGRGLLITGTENEISAKVLFDVEILDQAIKSGERHPYSSMKGVKQEKLLEFNESNTARVKQLFKNKKVLHHQQGVNHWIAQKDRKNVLKELRSGADINWSSVFDGIWDTPLVRAISILINIREANGESTKLVRSLLDEGVNVNQRGPAGYTPLMLACFDTRLHHLVPFLIQSGAKVDAQDDLGDTPLMQASRCPVPTAIKYLLEARADPLMKNKRNKNAMHVAIASGSNANMGILKTTIDGANLTHAINTHQRQDAASELELAEDISTRPHRNVF